MAKSSKPLSKRVLEAWTPPDNDPYLWDGELHGFGVRYNANGTITALLGYRNKYGQRRRYKVGRISDTYTITQARKDADTLQTDIRRGFDPLEHRQDTRQAPTLGEVFDQYLESAKFASKADSTQAMDKSRIKRHLRPTLGKLRIAQATPDKIRKAYADIRDGKTAVTEKTGKRGKARVTGGNTAATSCIKLLSSIFTWAIQEGLATENPCEGVQTAPIGVREAILDKTEQYTALFDALDALQEEAKIPAAAADAIRVLAFTGARRSEVTEARWSWVDLEAGTLTVPPKGHKSGHRTNKAKVIPLPSPARAVIAARPKGEPEDYVFPGTRGDSAITLPSKLWKTIREKAGLPDGITNHSLRHSLGTMMAVQGAEAAQIMAALGHSQMATTQRYIHIAKDARAAMLEQYTAGIAAAVAPKAEVVDLPRRKKQ
ncbi:MAG TPA: hypothetical protein DD491_15930 [Halieaceae bacterium]|nr:hypothetical protein [Halieaceae bacterium]